MYNGYLNAFAKSKSTKMKCEHNRSKEDSIEIVIGQPLVDSTNFIIQLVLQLFFGCLKFETGYGLLQSTRTLPCVIRTVTYIRYTVTFDNGLGIDKGVGVRVSVLLLLLRCSFVLSSNGFFQLLFSIQPTTQTHRRMVRIRFCPIDSIEFNYYVSTAALVQYNVIQNIHRMHSSHAQTDVGRASCIRR